MAQVERQKEQKADARKAKQEERKDARGRAEFVGFVNFKPNAAQKEGFKAWRESDERVAADTEELLGDGWKIGLARDKADGVFVSTIARWDAGHKEAGIILNCRTADAVYGHLRVVYAIVYVYECELSQYVVSGTRDDLF